MKRNGSALLIVLGMMAFMVVSAVAFSAYMRSSRLPSSFLRRSSASRQLAKAALASAIDEIDISIANNPHPGIGVKTIGDQNRNIWYGRVLCATESRQQIVESSQTVPVLTLEGLAYVPPPLVNEVRYYSRRTPTAGWQQFGFDCGRYAYCAVDVSDYFDVNRMSANIARSSASSRRISLSYLFEDGADHRAPGSKAASWDTFMEKFRTPEQSTMTFKYDSKVPLVSVADLNLALGVSGYGGFSSPFCKYIETSGGDGFYDNDFEMPKRMTFVTDSWFPEPAWATGDDEELDLNKPENQPFPASLIGGSGGPRATARSTTIMQLANMAQSLTSAELSTIGLATLYDYLDQDKVPVSLACPTFERTPMICGIKPTLNASFSLKVLDPDKAKKAANPDGTPLPETGTTPTREAYAKCEFIINPEFLTGLAGLSTETLLLYPFAHGDGVRDTSFKVDGRATFFFAKSGAMKLRSGESERNEKTHFTSKADIEASGLKADEGVILVPFSQQSKAFNADNIIRQEDALETVGLRGGRISGSEATRTPFVTLTYKWTQTLDEDTNRYKPEERPEDAEVVMAHCGMPPLTETGEIDSDFGSDEKFLGIVRGGETTVSLNMALALRVTDSNSQTVDLVPAHMKDDNTFNNVNNWTSFGPRGVQGLGKQYPLMRFGTGVSLTFSAKGLQEACSPTATDPTPKSVSIDDPRFNYAPESWYDSNGNIDKNTWLAGNVSEQHDGDIFLATSDQGYMQSIYELAFLPRLANLKNNGGVAGNLENPEDGRETFRDRGSARNRNLMWLSYAPFPNGRGINDSQAIEDLGFTSAGSGFKVNPYSNSTNVLMAAFANTPADWRVASTNNSEVGRSVMNNAAQFNQDYAWNDYSSGSHPNFKWSDLELIAGRFMDETVRQMDWRTAWRDLGWRYKYDDDLIENVPLSDETDDLWSVDRKFFYGFWRDCFETKQQLFLVFVRAEPMMMGGEGVNQAPPQLGARAVALVWRDPYENTGTGNVNGYPHRTRVLFYKHLE